MEEENKIPEPENRGEEQTKKEEAPAVKEESALDQLKKLDTELVQKMELIQQEIAKKLIGHNHLVEMIMNALICRGHVLLEGVPGVAKTLTARLIAKSINVGFSRIQFTPDLMPSDIIGTSVFNTKTAEFEFKKGPIFSNIILIDEVNRAPAKTQSALFEAMEERQVTVDGVTYKLEEPFFVIATQNPVEHEGTYKLPEAQLDRFMFKLNVPYPKLDDEIKILEAALQPTVFNNLDDVEVVLKPAELKKLQDIVQQVEVKPSILKYIAEIAETTRGSGQLYLGASPRASISILNSAKTIAGFRGRNFVTPQDVQDSLSNVLKHRLILSAEKEIEGVTVEDVISEIIEQVEVPR